MTRCAPPDAGDGSVEPPMYEVMRPGVATSERRRTTFARFAVQAAVPTGHRWAPRRRLATPPNRRPRLGRVEHVARGARGIRSAPAGRRTDPEARGVR